MKTYKLLIGIGLGLTFIPVFILIITGLMLLLQCGIVGIIFFTAFIGMFITLIGLFLFEYTELDLYQ